MPTPQTQKEKERENHDVTRSKFLERKGKFYKFTCKDIGDNVPMQTYVSKLYENKGDHALKSFQELETIARIKKYEKDIGCTFEYLRLDKPLSDRVTTTDKNRYEKSPHPFTCLS